MWGRGADDVWFAGGPDLVVHYDGSRFTSLTPPGPDYFYALWGSPAGPVWVGGDRGRIYSVAPGARGGYAFQRHYTGIEDYLPDSTVVFGLWGSGPDDVLAVGTGGNMVRWNGAYFTPEGAQAQGTFGLNAVAGSGDDVWAVGDRDTILRRNGGDWTPIPDARGPNLSGIFYGGKNDVWIVGDRGVALRWNGKVFEVQDQGDGKPLWGVFRPPGGDVWAVGGGGEKLDDAGRVVPGYGTISRWRSGAEPGSWVPAGTYAAPYLLMAAWGASANDLWAAGGHHVSAEGRRHGTIMHWDGTAWSVVKSDGDYILSGLWGSAADDIWAVGGIPSSNAEPGSGVILHNDGSSWGPALAVSSFLHSVSGANREQVWASGYNGAVLRRQGTAWVPVESGSGNDLSAIWLKGPDEVFFVGQYGTVLRRLGR